MGSHYVLRGHEAVAVDAMEWARWYEKANRRVARTEVPMAVSSCTVSTVFLLLASPPHIFETRVFGGPLDDEMERYATWEQAEAGHAAMVRRVRRGWRR